MDGGLGIGLLLSGGLASSPGELDSGSGVSWWGWKMCGTDDLPLPMQRGTFPTQLGWNCRSLQRTGSQQLPDLGLYPIGGKAAIWICSKAKTPTWNFPLWLPHWGGLVCGKRLWGDLALRSQRRAWG